MGKGIRLTKAEYAELESLDQAIGFGDFGNCVGKAWGTFMDKVRKSKEPAKPGADVGPIQTALVTASHGKAIALEGGHAIASRRCSDMKVTVEDAKLVGEWMARQGWLTGPMTLLDVLNKWYQWLPKARATQPPPALQPGLGSDDGRAGQSPAAAGTAPQGRRTPQGFR